MSAPVANEIALSNILYLTDFSPASEAALPFVRAIAASHGAEVFVLHVLVPDRYISMAPECASIIDEGQEQSAEVNMQKLEPQLAGLKHETAIVRGGEVWTAVQERVQKDHIDLLVLGTRGRTGIQKLLLGSVAEEIWRHVQVPVLTVGPSTRNLRPDGRFDCMLIATDFTSESLVALPYAVAMARESHARLILLHVIRHFKKGEIFGEQTAIEALHQLNKMLPPNADLWCIPELVVKHGNPAERIVEVAGTSGADLIVLGVRQGDDFGLATHAERRTAHHVVLHAPCPVLTIRG